MVPMVSGAAEAEHNAESRQKKKDTVPTTTLAMPKAVHRTVCTLELKVTSFSQRYAAFMTYNDVIQRLGANHAEGALERQG